MEKGSINTYVEYERIIEYLKTNIKDGGLEKIKKENIFNLVNILLNCKDVSTDYLKSYNEFIGFLEIYETEYNTKYTDLIKHILENMKEDDKQLLPYDKFGNPMLIPRPILERNSNIVYINNIINEDIYKLLNSIKSNMKNIIQFENQYLIFNANETNTNNTSFIRS